VGEAVPVAGTEAGKIVMVSPPPPTSWVLIVPLPWSVMLSTPLAVMMRCRNHAALDGKRVGSIAEIDIEIRRADLIGAVAGIDRS
jgi:hypothetical protein